MCEHCKVCIIGPSVEGDYLGGVATHMKTLKALTCFQDAVVLDPGSMHSNVRAGIFHITRHIADLRKVILHGDFSHVLINASIYPASFVKMLMILAVLPRGTKPIIHVFFHGGRFSGPIWHLLPFVAFAIRPLMAKVRKFHMLSPIQAAGFACLFPQHEHGLFANYSLSDDVLQRDQPRKDGPLRLLFVGRIVREKGVFDLIEAMRVLAGRRNDITLAFAGDGPALRELREISKTLPAGMVNFKGYLSGRALDDEYRRADAVLLPSYSEGFSYTVIEAMRAGAPIICTNEGALEYIVQDGKTGLKVEARDVLSIVQAIEKIDDDRALLEEMARNCHQYFREHLSKSAAEKYYRQLTEMR
ncbi:MAG: glycosyltransferase family 4 protein [Syntrophaceae bacterium]|nr:glycosyltransferase family 4 protein [Syntrophaceae bacterium]